MSNALRATQKGYQDKLDQIDRQVKDHEKGIETLKTQRKDVEVAKAVVDEAVAKLPKEEKKKPEPAAGK